MAEMGPNCKSIRAQHKYARTNKLLVLSAHCLALMHEFDVRRYFAFIDQKKTRFVCFFFFYFTELRAFITLWTTTESLFNIYLILLVASQIQLIIQRKFQRKFLISLYFHGNSQKLSDQWLLITAKLRQYIFMKTTPFTQTDKFVTLNQQRYSRKYRQKEQMCAYRTKRSCLRGTKTRRLYFTINCWLLCLHAVCRNGFQSRSHRIRWL